MAAGAAGAAVLLPQPTPAGLDGPSTPAAVPIVISPYDGASAVAAYPQLAPTRTLKTNASGIVTGSLCVPGGELASGQTVLEVDGAPVVGLATSVPLWRNLAPDAVGDDVRALQVELARLGHAVTVDERYGSDTREAIGQLLGTGAASGGSLALAQVVWLPAATVATQACAVVQGDSVAPGAEVATLAGSIASLQLAVTPHGDGWVAAYGDAVALIEAGGQVLDPAFLAVIEASPEFAATRDGPAAVGVEVDVRLAAPVDVAAVPPSAVRISGDGTGCVAADDGRSLPIHLVASSLGQSLVRFDSEVPAAVAGAYPQGLACP
jgi:hypothetical protein